MIDSNARGFYQKIFVDPVLSYIPCSPNVLTLCALVSGLMVPIWLYSERELLALLCLLLSGYLDTLDGSFARHSNQSSPSGAVLDIVSDRAVEWAAVLGLYLVDPSTRALSALVLMGAILLCVTSFLLVGVFSENDSEKSFHYSPGIMERSEAFSFFALMILFPVTYSYLAPLMAALIFLTAGIRVYEFIRRTMPAKGR